MSDCSRCIDLESQILLLESQRDRARELQRGAEAQHCAALARVEALKCHLAQWQAIARENAEEVRAARGRLAKAREALLFGANLLSGHRYQWEHEGDEESGQHDEDCRACEYEAMLARFEAALADDAPAPSAEPPGDVAKDTGFGQELRKLINRHSMEGGSNTQDWLLAGFMVDCLYAYEKAVRERDRLRDWLPPDEVERRIAKRFSEVLKLHVEDLRGEELDRKVRELVSKDMYPPGAPVMSLDDMREVLRSKEGWVSRDELNERIAEARDEALEEAAKEAADLLAESNPVPEVIRNLKSKKEQP